MKRTARRRLGLTLGIACLLPAGLLAHDLASLLFDAAGRRAAGPAAAAAAPPLDVTALKLPPLDGLSASRERPLFIATRRFPPVAAGTGSVDLVLGKYRVQGVVILPKRSFVLLRPAAGGKAFRVREGDKLEGQLFEKIDADGVTLSGPAGRRTYPVGGPGGQRK